MVNRYARNQMAGLERMHPGQEVALDRCRAIFLRILVVFSRFVVEIPVARRGIATCLLIRCRNS
jgi:hypothetical protein